MENLNSHCRVCLVKPTEENTLDVTIIYDENDNLSYGECFKIIAGIDLNSCGEREPRTLCKDCALELKISYDFRKKLAESNKILQPLLKAQQQVPNQSYDNLQEDEKQFLENVNFVVLDGEQSQEYVIGCNTEIELTTANSEACLLIDQTVVQEKSEDQEYNNETLLDFEYETIEEVIVEEETIVPSLVENSNVAIDNGTRPTPFRATDRFKKVKMRQHSSMEDPTSGYVCSYCDKKFKLYCRMVSHQRIHEDNRPKFPCNICKRSYASKQARRVHDQTVHEIGGAFVCGVCGKRFAINKLLEIHMRYHTRDFPFACIQCGKTFAQRSHLETHKNVKHKSSRFICVFKNCGKLFTSSTSLRNHECTHSSWPFECAECKCGYPSKSKLKNHLQKKHKLEMTSEQLEEMRKFHVKRSKLNLVQISSLESQ